MARVGMLPMKKNLRYAVQMPAQRGQVFAAIYQVSPTWSLIDLLPDTVMTPETWLKL